MRRLVALVLAWSTITSLATAPVAIGQERPRVFGKPPEAKVYANAADASAAPVPAPTPATPAAPDPAIEQLRAEVAELRAREAARSAPAAPVAGPRLRMESGLELSRLSPYDQQRYIEVSGQNRRIAFPITLIAVAGTALTGVLIAYFALIGSTCPVDYYEPQTDQALAPYYKGAEESCGAPPGVVVVTAIPTVAAIVVGSIMLHRRLPRRREYQALERKAMFAPVLSRHSISLAVRF